MIPARLKAESDSTKKSEGAKEAIRVLVVDDEPSYREYLKRYLARKGYLVRTASSGAEAIALGREFRPQVILADWMLKNHMHGLDVGQALRDQDPELQILVMTGFPSSEIREEAERARVFRFLEKPFGLDEVASAIAAATSARSS
jgi:two-component system OmpR family response regulator